MLSLRHHLTSGVWVSTGPDGDSPHTQDGGFMCAELGPTPGVPDLGGVTRGLRICFSILAFRKSVKIITQKGTRFR